MIIDYPTNPALVVDICYNISFEWIFANFSQILSLGIWNLVGELILKMYIPIFIIHVFKWAIFVNEGIYRDK